MFASPILMLSLCVAFVPLEVAAQPGSEPRRATEVPTGAAAPLAIRVLLPTGEGTIEAPYVEFDSGKLRVVSDDATLGDVLRAIGDSIGARIEFPDEIGDERVAARLGPAPPQGLLRALLDSSRFDYVMLGSPSDPGAVQTVVVNLRKPANTPLNQVHLVGAAVPTAGAPVYAGIPTPVRPVVKPATVVQQLTTDHDGVQRLPNGLTPEEQRMSQQELYDKMEFYRQKQRAEQQAQRDGRSGQVAPR
jgi:hypothetical protein